MESITALVSFGESKFGFHSKSTSITPVNAGAVNQKTKKSTGKHR